VRASQQEPDAVAGASFSEESPEALNTAAPCAHSPELEYIIDGHTPANNRADRNGATRRDIDYERNQPDRDRLSRFAVVNCSPMPSSPRTRDRMICGRHRRASDEMIKWW
jgi:hypothetical protein